MSLNGVKKHIDNLIELELKSDDLNLILLVKWTHNSAIIDLSGIHLVCPCRIETDGRMHFSCSRNCLSCIYSVYFMLIIDNFGNLFDAEQLVAVKYLSNELYKLNHKLTRGF